VCVCVCVAMVPARLVLRRCSRLNRVSLGALSRPGPVRSCLLPACNSGACRPPQAAVLRSLSSSHRAFASKGPRSTRDEERDRSATGDGQKPAEKESGAEADAKGGDQKEQKPPESSGSSGRGEAIGLLGLSGLGLSMILRNPAAARALRIAGPGGMILGAIISIYEIGGWRLLLAIPVTLVSYKGAVHFSDQRLEGELKQDVVSAVSSACPQAPEELFAVLHAERGREYETNKFSLEVESARKADGPMWRLELCALRPSRFQAWSLSSLKVLRGEAAQPSLPSGASGSEDPPPPPPQTRYWSRPSVDWQLVWQQQS